MWRGGGGGRGRGRGVRRGGTPNAQPCAKAHPPGRVQRAVHRAGIRPNSDVGPDLTTGPRAGDRPAYSSTPRAAKPVAGSVRAADALRQGRRLDGGVKCESADGLVGPVSSSRPIRRAAGFAAPTSHAAHLQKMAAHCARGACPASARLPPSPTPSRVAHSSGAYVLALVSTCCLAVLLLLPMAHYGTGVGYDSRLTACEKSPPNSDVQQALFVWAGVSPVPLWRLLSAQRLSTC